MSIVCPQCNATVLDNAIHSKTAQCPECGYEFSVARLLQGEEERKKTEMVYDIPMPARIQKYVDGEKLVITRTWRRWMGIGLILFSVPFATVTLLMLIAVLQGDWTLCISFVFGGFVTTFIMVNALQNILNTTIIEVEARHIMVRHLPISFRAYRSVFTRDTFVQAYVKGGGINRQREFDVILILDTGEHGILLKNLPNPEQAQYIEQEIEKFLGIEDAVVRGEYDSEGTLLRSVIQIFTPKRETKYKF